MSRMRAVLLSILLLIPFPAVLLAEDSATPPRERTALEKIWRARLQSFLDRGVIPLIDLESSLDEDDGKKYLAASMVEMDRLGVALIAFDGYQRPKIFGGRSDGYRWGDYIDRISSAHPDHFIPATNGGTNSNWLQQKDSFIGQLEREVRRGRYPIMGEFDFRHYQSSHQCHTGNTGRDNDVPLNSFNGRRLFQLAQETGIAFAIHLEPEDEPLKALEEMLRAYPKARVIVAHFGQIRHPEKEKMFGPDLVRRLLTTYPNLHYDLSTGEPGRRYACNNDILDTVLWEGSAESQKDILQQEYKAILTEFSTRFVAGTDYGGGRAPLPEFMRQRVANIRLILRDLPETAKHDIGYRNAWRLLTGNPWQ